MREINITDFYKDVDEITKEALRLRFFPLRDGSILSLPAAVIGKGNGPLIVITSAMHGDEINGIYCCHLIYRALRGEEIRGKIIILPVANPPAFNQGARISSIDYIDMNRTFSFVEKRKPTEHVAGLLFKKIISRANIVFDLHTGGPGEYLPQVLVMGEKALEEAFHLNMGIIRHMPRKGTFLLPNCEKRGITSFAIEMGRALTLNYDYCKKFLKGFLNYLVYKEMMDGELDTIPDQRKFADKIFIPAKSYGFFQPCVTLGQDVIKGQIIGKIETLFHDEPLKVFSPRTGVVLYLRYDDSVGFGDSLVHIGY